jgi:hypothetical protein
MPDAWSTWVVEWMTRRGNFVAFGAAASTRIRDPFEIAM